MINKLLAIFTETHSHFDGQEPEEVVILLLRPHLFTILLPMSLLFLAALIPIGIWIWLSDKISLVELQALFSFLISLYYLGLWSLLFYFLTIYSLNIVIITDRRIIQNEQYGYFSRKISELQTYRVQDISINVRGMIETFLNFGDIRVQTAGSEREFIFKKIPNPGQVKDSIMQVVTAHQAKLQLL